MTEQQFSMEQNKWTFDQWSSFLKLLKTGEPAAQEIRKASVKKLAYARRVRDKLIEPLYDAVFAMLNRRLREFNARLYSLFESGDARFLDYEFARLDGRLKECLFFENMKFIDESDREKLREEVISYVENQWKPAVRQWASKELLKQNNPAMEDILYLLTKVRFLYHE